MKVWRTIFFSYHHQVSWTRNDKSEKTRLFSAIPRRDIFIRVNDSSLSPTTPPTLKRVSALRSRRVQYIPIIITTNYFRRVPDVLTATPMAETWDPYRRVKMESITVKSAETETTTTSSNTTEVVAASAAAVARCAGRRPRRRPRHRPRPRRPPPLSWNRRPSSNGTTAPSRAITGCTTCRWTATFRRRRPNGTRRRPAAAAARRPAARRITTTAITTITTTTDRTTIGTPRRRATVRRVAAAITICRYRRARLKASCRRRRRWLNGSTTPRVTTTVMAPPSETIPFIRGTSFALRSVGGGRCFMTRSFGVGESKLVYSLSVRKGLLTVLRKRSASI